MNKEEVFTIIYTIILIVFIIETFMYSVSLNSLAKSTQRLENVLRDRFIIEQYE